METLKDTVGLMNSNDYKERFKAEYYQTKIRYEKLKTFVTRIQAAEATKYQSNSVKEPVHETPLEVAKNNGHKEIVEILENKMQELKAKEEMKNKIEAIKENKLKEEQEKENKFTKMTKGEMYRLDIDKLPEVSLCGEINVNLADYKKDLEALKTFGRTKNEDETIEIDRGEKLVSFEDKSNHVSRKHLSVVNFGGNLYMQDRSLNGTGMREASKTDKAKTLIKPMEKER